MSQGLSDLTLARLSGILFPADLVAVVLSALVVDALVHAVLAPGGPLRTIVGAPLLFFFPGYAFAAALFPARAATGDATVGSGVGGGTGWLPARGIDGVERLVLSVGLSAVILPVLGLALSATSTGLAPSVIATTLTGFVVVTSVVAAARRARLPEDERFRISVREGSATALRGLLGVSRLETGVNVVLAISVTLTVVALGFAVAAPQSAAGFTDFHLLTESSDGDLVAAEYPTRLDSDTEPLVIGVENHEGATQSYTVIVQLQRVGDDGTVDERRELARYGPTVGPGETWTTRHRPEPAMTGTDLRLTYLLYRDDPPANPTIENAYREVHLWVNAEVP